jgi:hypothetical protein
MAAQKTFRKCIRDGVTFRTLDGTFLFAIADENTVVFSADDGLKDEEGAPLAGRERYRDCILFSRSIVLLQRDAGWDEYQFA